MTARKYLCVLLAAALLCGCGSASNSSTESKAEDGKSEITDSSNTEQPENTDSNSKPVKLSEGVPVCTEQGAEIGFVDIRDGLATLTPQGIVYSRADTVGEAQSLGADIDRMDYFLFDPETGESRLLGSIGEFEYECGFSRVLNDGHLYILASTGNVYEDDQCVQKIFDIDLKACTMSEIYSGLDPTVYGGMALLGSELFFIQGSGRRVTALDLKSGSTRTAAEFSFDDGSNSGELIRQLCVDGDSLCLLRLKMSGESDVGLYIDRCSPDGSLQESLDISAISRDIQNFTDDDKRSELRMPVSGFRVSGKAFYYENFSTCRYLGEVTDSGLAAFYDCTTLPNSDVGEFTQALQPAGSEPLFFWSLNKEGSLLRLKDGKLTEEHLTPPEGDWALMQVSSCGDAVLALYSDFDNSHRGDDGERPMRFVLR